MRRPTGLLWPWRHSPEIQTAGRPVPTEPEKNPPNRFRPAARRAADRHYLAVVAAEARRLARQLRPTVPPPNPPRVRPDGSH